MPTLSVIIPTHRRPHILARCLEALARQSITDTLEVIVVNDVHDDQETTRVATTQRSLTVRLVESAPCQQGVARNRGVAMASAPHILFIGDDIFLAPESCARHLHMHHRSRSSPSAVLGFTTWDPACGITPVMRWLEKSGWQFGYPALDRLRRMQPTLVVPHSLQHRYTYASNISLPRELALLHPFRTDVHLYGWEDIEWGMRLRDAGVPLVYAPAARALHHHHITIEDSLRRMETLGRSAKELERSVPGFDRVPRGWKLRATQCLALLPTMAGRHRRAFLGGGVYINAERLIRFFAAESKNLRLPPLGSD